MLVLSRKSGEIIDLTVPACAIDQVIKLRIVEIRGDKVRLGFDADGWVKIHRQEIKDAIEATKLTVGK